MKMEQTECSETSVYKIQTPGNYPKESIQHTEHGERLKLRIIYLLTAVGLTPGGSCTVHIYTQTIHRTIQLIWEECGPCPVFASYTLVFALQLRKKSTQKPNIKSVRL